MRMRAQRIVAVSRVLSFFIHSSLGGCPRIKSVTLCAMFTHAVRTSSLTWLVKWHPIGDENVVSYRP